MSLLACLFVGISLVTAQTQTVTGVVISEDDGLPVVGASVLVKDTNLGTVSDLDGKFRLSNIPSTAKSLVVSYIGMQTQEFAIKSNMTIYLKSDSELLDEVMIIAYGTAKKSSFTGSATTVKSEEIQKRQLSNVTKAIDGLAPGVQATSGSGQPGSSANIYIRGLGSINAGNTPLYVVDGMPYDGAISAISPDDIENITILKDASASALYGSRGANGVIMITTKKGKEGRTEVSLKAVVGMSSRALPRYETMKSKQYVEALYSAYYNEFGSGAIAEMTTGATKIFGPNEKYNPFNYSIADLINTATGKVRDDAQLLWEDDWLDEVTRKNALRQEYVFGVNGGNEKSQFMFSLGYVNEDGILETTNFQRYTGRASIEVQPKDWFATGFSTNFAHYVSNSSQTSTSATSNVWYSAALMGPIFPIYERDRTNGGAFVLDENGDRVFDYGSGRPTGLQQDFNSVATLYDDRYRAAVDNLSGRTHLDFGNMKDGWSEGLTLRLNFGFDYYNNSSMTYYNPYFGNGASVNGRITKSNRKTLGYTFNQLLSYARDFGKHNIDVMVGHEWYAMRSEYLAAGKTGFPFGDLFELDAASTIASANSSTDRYRIESYLSRVNYSYADKYYLSGSFRRDGSSRFHRDNRWGNFWSVGGNYRVSQEEFMSDLDWISNLAVRASYGVQGNDALSTYYAWQSLYDLGYSNANESGAIVSAVANKNLTWETNHNLNVGLDLGLFDQRLQIGLEWYSRKTTDLLLYYPLPMSSGFEGYYRNSGSMRNQGFEATITGRLMEKKDFSWDLTVMASTMKNKVLKLTDDGKDILSGNQIIREGEAIYSYYLCRSAGVDPATGDQLFWANVDGSGKSVDPYITTNETYAQASRYVAGSKLPSLFGSISTNLKYKGFDLSIATNYSIGGKMIDGVYNSLMGFYYAGQAKHVNLERAWKQPGDVTDIPRYQIGKSIPATDDQLINASYFALKNISLGYTLPTRLVKSWGMGDVRFAVTGDNIYTFTHLKGMDPQYSVTGGTTYVYAPNRTISFSVDVKF